MKTERSKASPYSSASASLASLVAPYSPDAVDLANVSSGSSLAHLLGTDAVGRDLLYGVIDPRIRRAGG